MKSCKHLYDFVKWRRMNPSDIMDIWLKGDANNLPSQILFPRLSGDKAPLLLPLLVQTHSNCGQKSLGEGSYFPSGCPQNASFCYWMVKRINSHSWLSVWIELLNVCADLWVWIYRRSGRIAAWDVRDNSTLESERKLSEIKNLLTWIIFCTTTYAVKPSSNQYITWLHFKWWHLSFFPRMLWSLIKEN